MHSIYGIILLGFRLCLLKNSSGFIHCRYFHVLSVQIFNTGEVNTRYIKYVFCLVLWK